MSWVVLQGSKLLVARSDQSQVEDDILGVVLKGILPPASPLTNIIKHLCFPADLLSM